MSDGTRTVDRVNAALNEIEARVLRARSDWPDRRDDGICLHTHCHRPAGDESPWCVDHTRGVEKDDERRAAKVVAYDLAERIDRDERLLKQVEVVTYNAAQLLELLRPWDGHGSRVRERCSALTLSLAALDALPSERAAEVGR